MGGWRDEEASVSNDRERDLPGVMTLSERQGAVLAALSGASTADTRFLRRITGTNRAGLQLETSALVREGLIRQTEGSGFFWRLLTVKRNEAFYEITAAGRAHPYVRGSEQHDDR